MSAVGLADPFVPTAWSVGVAELPRDLASLLLVVGPAVVGLAALIGAIFLISRPREPDEVYVGRWIGVGVLLIVTLGIGTCYAFVLTNPL